MDLFFVGKGLYDFPNRPFPDVFSIDIMFTVVCMPVFIVFFLFVGQHMSIKGRWLLFIVLSIGGAGLEMAAESAGFLNHADTWRHEYTAGGYFIFITLVWKIFRFAG
jgi:hypothetical protein